MKLLAGFTALGLVLAVSGPAFAQQSADPETAQFMCDLTGDCSTPSEAQGATGTNEPAPAAGTPTVRRGGSVRGFSFRRAGATDSSASASAPSAVATQQAVARPSQVGQTNMGLTFVPGSATLTAAAKQRLARYAVALQTPSLSARRLRIEGHTDATGSVASNELLSRQRAQAAADFLVAAGVQRDRLDVVGYGSRNPLPNTAPSAAANRRVMAVLL